MQKILKPLLEVVKERGWRIELGYRDGLWNSERTEDQKRWFLFDSEDWFLGAHPDLEECLLKGIKLGS